MGLYCLKNIKDQSNLFDRKLKKKHHFFGNRSKIQTVCVLI